MDSAYSPTETISLGARWSVPHPIPYQGSKRHLASVILPFFPSSFDRLVEPFAGSAAISLACAYRKMTSKFWLNDGHLPLVKLWREIVNRPEELADGYEKLWKAQAGQERKYYDLVRSEFNRSQCPTAFLYLLARCVKAAIRYNAQGEFNNSPDNRRKGALPKTMRLRIEGAANLLGRRSRITCKDYSAVLRDSTPSDVVYMDPPYQGVCGDRDARYAPKFEHEQFCEELQLLNRRKCMFVVSYDGRMGEKTYGKPLPKSLDLRHIEICAGRSTQATLLGQEEYTFESLYLSPALATALAKDPAGHKPSGDQHCFEW